MNERKPTRITDFSQHFYIQTQQPNRVNVGAIVSFYRIIEQKEKVKVQENENEKEKEIVKQVISCYGNVLDEAMKQDEHIIEKLLQTNQVITVLHSSGIESNYIFAIQLDATSEKKDASKIPYTNLFVESLNKAYQYCLDSILFDFTQFQFVFHVGMKSTEKLEKIISQQFAEAILIFFMGIEDYYEDEKKEERGSYLTASYRGKIIVNCSNNFQKDREFVNELRGKRSLLINIFKQTDEDECLKLIKDFSKLNDNWIQHHQNTLPKQFNPSRKDFANAETLIEYLITDDCSNMNDKNFCSLKSRTTCTQLSQDKVDIDKRKVQNSIAVGNVLVQLMETLVDELNMK